MNRQLPLLTFIFQQGCGACEETKPEFVKFQREFPKLPSRLADIDTLKLDYVAAVTPTLELRMPRGLYKTDPVAMNKNLTAAVIEKWVRDCLNNYAGRFGVKP